MPEEAAIIVTILLVILFFGLGFYLFYTLESLHFTLQREREEEDAEVTFQKLFCLSFVTSIAQILFRTNSGPESGAGQPSQGAIAEHFVSLTKILQLKYIPYVHEQFQCWSARTICMMWTTICGASLLSEFFCAAVDC